METSFEYLGTAHMAGIRIVLSEGDGRRIGHCYLYLLRNGQHARPFGLVEDVHVEPGLRGQGHGRRLVEQAVDAARQHGCYKLVLTARHARDRLHDWYRDLGFEDHGRAFRMDLDTTG